MPKFQIESEHENLKEALQRLGLTSMFNSFEADFSGISDRRRLWVEAAIQKAYIKVFAFIFPLKVAYIF